MSDINCNACNELKSTSPNFVQKGIGDTECTSLAADTGLNPSLSPKHNDVEDLHDMNDCLIGAVPNTLESYEICDWQDFMSEFIANLYTMYKGIICALGGIWNYIHNLLSRVASLETRMTNVEGRVSALETWKAAIDAWKSGIDSWKTSISNTVNNHGNAINYQASQISNINNKIDEIIAAMGGSTNTIPVFKRYRYTVPAANFNPVWRVDLSGAERMLEGSWGPLTGGIVHWMAGSGHGDDQGQGEGVWIQIPVSEMENITGVWGQTWVLPGRNPWDGTGKPYMQTVSIQQWYQDGNYLIVNFDTHVTAPVRQTADGSVTQNGAPYPVTIDFLVTGTKTITT